MGFYAAPFMMTLNNSAITNQMKFLLYIAVAVARVKDAPAEFVIDAIDEAVSWESGQIRSDPRYEAQAVLESRMTDEVYGAWYREARTGLKQLGYTEEPVGGS